MKLPWFHLERIPATGSSVEFEAAEARHAGRSTRLRPGDRAVVSDGRGLTAEVVLEKTERNRATARVQALIPVAPRRPSLHLASALPKGDRLATLLSMATQLGMTSFTPLICHRSVVQPPESPPARWQRIVREAAKQSRQAWLPTFAPPTTPAKLAAAIDFPEILIRMDPDGEPAHKWLQNERHRALDSVRLMIGPEGGFTPEETNALDDRGARAIALATGILRVETAAVASLARVSALREETLSEG